MQYASRARRGTMGAVARQDAIHAAIHAALHAAFTHAHTAEIVYANGGEAPG